MTASHGPVCTVCGGCCYGISVSILEPGTEERVAGLAASLGVERPFLGGTFRMENDHCVLLGSDGGCRLHRAYGEAVKPWMCRQYPVLARRTGQGVRLGLDPACYSALLTHRSGWEPDPAEVAVYEAPLDAREARAEQELLALLRAPGATVASLVSSLRAYAACPDLPPAFSATWIRRLQAARGALLVALASPTASAAFREAMQPVASRIPDLDPDASPPWPVLGSEAEAWAVTACRSMTALRMCPTVPRVSVALLLQLGGAVACGWTRPEPEAFARSLAGWFRWIRKGRNWMALLPEPELALELLGRGGARGG